MRILHMILYYMFRPLLYITGYVWITKTVKRKDMLATVLPPDTLLRLDVLDKGQKMLKKVV
jgi:hypothetical protein